MAEQEGNVTPVQSEQGGNASVGGEVAMAGVPAAAGVSAAAAEPVASAPATDGMATASALAAASGPVAPAPAPKAGPSDPFIRAENEDDDGYDPYSDRPAPREPMFERDPWG